MGWLSKLLSDSFDWNFESHVKKGNFSVAAWASENSFGKVYEGNWMLSVSIHKTWCASRRSFFMLGHKNARKFMFLRVFCFETFNFSRSEKFSNWSWVCDKRWLHSWSILFIHAFVVGVPAEGWFFTDTMWMIFFHLWNFTERKKFPRKIIFKSLNGINSHR